MPNQKIKNLLTENVSIAPLAVFRILFGGVMLWSVIRFVTNGWVEEQYVVPTFFFTYYGFDWVKPLSETGMYALFTLMGLSALMMMLGCFYRIFSLLFFLSFTYVELIDQTNYLNHYYFISIVSILMMLVPVHRSFSLDVFRNPKIELTHVPCWMILTFQLQLAIVYFYAGIAKLNYDWLVSAQPLRIWLPSNSGLPLIGWLFEYVWVAYVFSWFGAVYDIFVPFLLWLKKTRRFAFALVIGFHLMTGLLFPIGMFPYIMILLTLIFFPAAFHERIIGWLKTFYYQTINVIASSDNKAISDAPGRSNPQLQSISQGIALPDSALRQGSQSRNDGKFLEWQSKYFANLLVIIFIIHFMIQLLLPFRYKLYPGNLFWTEQGYRFSWRVMLMEKAGTCFFYVTDPETSGTDEVSPGDYLTKQQEKMMSTQPDMILQFAHYLKNVYREKGIENPEVRVESYVTLNGKGSRLFIDPDVNLVSQKESFRHKDWILLFEENQKQLASVLEVE